MKKILLIIISFIIWSVSYSQTDCIEWADINGKSINNEHWYSKELLKRHLQKHERKFKRKWKKCHILLGKTTLKRLFSEMEMFYIPRYHIAKIDSESVMLTTINNKPISNIVFVYNGYYLGDFFYNRCNTLTNKKIRNDYWNNLNYGIISGHYAGYLIDKNFLLDFISKGFPVFALDNYCDKDIKDCFFWFSTDDSDRPIKFDSNVIWEKILSYDTDSKYKSQFFVE